MIGRTTIREFPLTSINNLTSPTMPSQPYSRVSPSEGLSIARQVMNDAVTFYLEHGGPAEARAHVENLANELKIYDDCAEAYREAMGRIVAYEEAERQKAEECQRQQIQDLMKSILDAVQSEQPPVALPNSVNERIKHALDYLQKEKLLIHKYDYAWIMRYINENQLKEIGLYFYSVSSYRNYIIDQMGHPKVAGISTLSQYYGYVDGRFPDWTFSDTKNVGEILRRINIVRRFSAIFIKGR